MLTTPHTIYARRPPAERRARAVTHRSFDPLAGCARSHGNG
ncbi:hypothetical protein SXCC_04769 [Gluconacetobacter sp. SXCC-1]|nr:hypothetical protein SXCC_04769 [Gluconacetobacter sp. SXCC-1]